MAYVLGLLLVLFMLAALLGALVVVVGWPWLLGSWVAVHGFGAADPSIVRTLTGWVFEVLWVVVMVLVFMGIGPDRIRPWVRHVRRVELTSERLDQSVLDVRTSFAVTSSASFVFAVVGLTMWIGEIGRPNPACSGSYASESSRCADTTAFGPWITVAALVLLFLHVRWWSRLPNPDPARRPEKSSVRSKSSPAVPHHRKWSLGAIVLAVWMTLIFVVCPIAVIVANNSGR